MQGLFFSFVDHCFISCSAGRIDTWRHMIRYLIRQLDSDDVAWLFVSTLPRSILLLISPPCFSSMEFDSPVLYFSMFSFVCFELG